MVLCTHLCMGIQSFPDENNFKFSLQENDCEIKENVFCYKRLTEISKGQDIFKVFSLYQKRNVLRETMLTFTLRLPINGFL